MVQAMSGQADQANHEAHGLLDSGSRAEEALGRNDAAGNLHIGCGALSPLKKAEARDLRIRFSYSDECPYLAVK